MISTCNPRRMTAMVFVAFLAYCLLVLVFRQTISSDTSHSMPAPAIAYKLKPICSVELIRKYCMEHNYFPTSGRWINSTFQSELCRIPFKDVSKKIIMKCLTRRKMKKLVIIGDSNGSRYFQAAKRLLGKFLKCDTLKIEQGTTLPDVKYFTKGTRLKASDIVVHHRDCRGCNSNTILCTDGALKIVIEYIAMEFFIDTEVTTVRNQWQKNCPPRKQTLFCHQSNTYQEFILGEYLVNDYPNVILLFSSSHDKARGSISKVRLDMDYLKMLINTYVPKQTQLFWFSKISETLKKKPALWRNVTYDGNWKTNKQIQLLNRELYNVLRPELNRTDGKFSTFFDIFHMSQGVPHWSLDGIHRIPIWYDVVLSIWFQTALIQQRKYEFSEYFMIV